MGGFWTTLGATSLFACVAFGGLGIALAIPFFVGRKARRRCACAAARDVMRLAEERDRATFDAKRYRPEKVDLTDLPQISSDLAGWIRNRAKKTLENSEPQVETCEKSPQNGVETGFIR